MTLLSSATTDMPFIVFNQSLLDGRIQLGAEEIIRSMALGTTWMKLRLGVRLAVQAGAGTSGYSDLWMGLCQGPNGWTSSNTVDAVAMHPGSVYGSGATLAYNASGYVATNNQVYIARKVGTAIVAGQFEAIGGNQSTFLVASPLVNTVRSAFYADFIKSAGNITITSWVPGTAAMGMLDVSRYQHLSNMENEAAPGVGGTTWISSGAQSTLAIPGSAQLWDTVLVSWSRSTPVIEIDDITVVRFY